MKRRLPGEGSLYQVVDARGKPRWIAQVSYGLRGARTVVRRSSTSKARARELLRQMVLEHRAPDSSMTLGDYLQRWAGEHEKRVGPGQAANVRSIIRVHLVPVLGNVPLSLLRPDDVQRSVGAVEGSASTRRNVYDVLAKALADAEFDGLIDVSPVRRVKRPVVRHVEQRPWSEAQVRRFLEAIRGDRYEALYVMAAGTGLRQAELLGLAWSDVDLEHGTVDVALQLRRVAGQFVRVPRKSGGRAYAIEIPPSAVEALRGHRERQDAERPHDQDSLVFVTEEGRPVDGGVVRRRMQRVVAAVGLPAQTFHGFRRFYASLLASRGFHPSVVQHQLGHSEVTTALKSYTYVVDGASRAAADAVESALSGDQ